MEWPLVGREDELRRLSVVLLGRPAAVVLAGAAGVGKSRLLDELSQRATATGWAVERVMASPSAATIPFGAVAHLLPEDLSNDRLSLLRRTERQLARRAEEQPLVLLVDDAHELDDGTVALLHRVAASGTLRLVLALRSGGSVPETVTRIWKDGFAERLEVGPLGRAETAAMVEAALGGPLDPATEAHLWTATKGHPLFVRLVVEGAVETGGLQDTDGCWTLHETLAFTPRLTEVIESRLERLDPAARRAFDVVAVAGAVAPEHLVLLSDAAGAAALAGAGLVSVDQRGHVHAAHPLYAELALLALPAPTASEIRGQLATLILERTPVERTDLVRAASWHLDSRHDTAPALLVRAAREALALCDFDLAARLASAAQAARSGAADHDAAFTLGQALRYAGRGSEADDAFELAERCAPTDAARAATAVARAHNEAFVRGRFLDAVRLLRRSSAGLEDRNAVRQLDIERTFLASVIGDFRHVSEAARGILADPGAADVVILSSAVAAAFAAVMTVRTGDLDAVVERAMPLAEQLEMQLPLARHQLLVTAALGRVAQGRVHDAVTEARAGLDGTDGGPGTGEWAIVLAFALGLGGDPRQAARIASLGTTTLTAADPLGFLPVAHAITAVSLAQAGDLHAAAAHLDRATDPRSEADRRVRALITERVAAWRSAWEGDTALAARVVARAGYDAFEASHRLWGLVALHDAVRFGQPGECLDLLRAATAECDGALAPALLEHGEALAAGDPRRLLAAAGVLAETGARLLAAEAAAQSATRWDSLGDGTAAVRAATSAQCYAPAPDVLTPALRARPAGLTERELEIGRAAAGGSASREIADRLVLSVRTVDNHLLRVYRKLGISGRDELVVAVPQLSSAAPPVE